MGFFKEILSDIKYNIVEAKKNTDQIRETTYQVNNKLFNIYNDIKSIKSDIDVTKCCCEGEKRYENMGIKAILDEWVERQAEIMRLENELKNKSKTLNND